MEQIYTALWVRGIHIHIYSEATSIEVHQSDVGCDVCGLSENVQFASRKEVRAHKSKAKSWKQVECACQQGWTETHWAEIMFFENSILEIEIILRSGRSWIFPLR